MSGEIRLAAFDLGNVMVDVQESIPARKLAELSGQPQDVVFDAIFSARKKLQFESGEVSWETHASNAISGLDLPLSARELREIYCESLIPDEQVIATVSRVAESTRITIASNTSEPHWEWVQKNLPFAHRFDPPIISYLVGVMKPDSGFYEALLDRSGLQPGEIFFTDDRPENIETAEELGIRAFLFTGHEKLDADLASCGVPV